MSTTPAPTRVFGFVAAEADVCVLLRVGPGKRTLMLRWDLATDTFDIGQWLVAWISDGALSPDGRLFAFHGVRRIYNPNALWDRWRGYNVVCRPPFFTALAYWGTRYESKRLRWIEGNDPSITAPEKGSVPVAFRSRLALEDCPVWPERPPDRMPPRFFRPASVGELILYRERLHPDLYSLNDDILEADWADVDHRGRILLTRKGRVYVCDAEGDRELIDLNPFEFRPVASPAWATRWP